MRHVYDRDTRALKSDIDCLNAHNLDLQEKASGNPFEAFHEAIHSLIAALDNEGQKIASRLVFLWFENQKISRECERLDIENQKMKLEAKKKDSAPKGLDDETTKEGKTK